MRYEHTYINKHFIPSAHSYLDLVPHEGFTGLRSHSHTGHLIYSFIGRLFSHMDVRDPEGCILINKRLQASTSRKRFTPKAIERNPQDTGLSHRVVIYHAIIRKSTHACRDTIDDQVIIPVFHHPFFTLIKVRGNN